MWHRVFTLCLKRNWRRAPRFKLSAVKKAFIGRLEINLVNHDVYQFCKYIQNLSLYFVFWRTLPCIAPFCPFGHVISIHGICYKCWQFAFRTTIDVRKKVGFMKISWFLLGNDEKFGERSDDFLGEKWTGVRALSCGWGWARARNFGTESGTTSPLWCGGDVWALSALASLLCKLYPSPMYYIVPLCSMYKS